MSLSFAEDRLSSKSPPGQCLLLGLMQGQMKTNSERKNILVTWSHTHNACVLICISKVQTSKLQFCAYLEILWDMGAPLFHLSVWWATEHPGRA